MPYIINDNCTACGVCEPGCDSAAISQNNGTYVINPYACTECGNCEEVCPVNGVNRE